MQQQQACYFTLRNIKQELVCVTTTTEQTDRAHGLNNRIHQSETLQGPSLRNIKTSTPLSRYFISEYGALQDEVCGKVLSML